MKGIETFLNFSPLPNIADSGSLLLKEMKGIETVITNDHPTEGESSLLLKEMKGIETKWTSAT